MKYVTTAALLLALGASAPAFAQTPPPTPNAGQRQEFRQMRQQMEQIHKQARAEILGALTPAHKSLLATVAGQLATSVNPDYNAAAQRLDAALSSGEKQKIVAAAQSAMAKARAAMEAMRAQMPQEPGGPMMRAGGMGMGPHGAQESKRMTDAGWILLHMTAAGGPGMHMEHPPMHP